MLDESVSYEIIYSVALHESLKYQQDFIFLNLGKDCLAKIIKMSY